LEEVRKDASPPPHADSFAPNDRPDRSLRLRASGRQRLATLRRAAADRHAARCASRDLCSGVRPSAPYALESVMTLPGNSLLSTIRDKCHTNGWLIRAANDNSEDRTAIVVRDGNTVHMAKGCRLGGLLILLTEKRRKARGIL
jgi:hypothetical protein